MNCAHYLYLISNERKKNTMWNCKCAMISSDVDAMLVISRKYYVSFNDHFGDGQICSYLFHAGSPHIITITIHETLCGFVYVVFFLFKHHRASDCWIPMNFITCLCFAHFFLKPKWDTRNRAISLPRNCIRQLSYGYRWEHT